NNASPPHRDPGASGIVPKFSGLSAPVPANISGVIAKYFEYASPRGGAPLLTYTSTFAWPGSTLTNSNDPSGSKRISDLHLSIRRNDPGALGLKSGSDSGSDDRRALPTSHV